MIGRFIDHDGGTANRPAVRFGNISVMPAPIARRGYSKVDYFCVDMHSRSGFSGSPVFAYRTFGQDLTGADILSVNNDVQRAARNIEMGRPSSFQIRFRPVFVLLGIHCGQFSEDWGVKASSGSTGGSSNVTISAVEGMRVEGLSGMAIVAPAWRIADLVLNERFADARAASFQTLTQSHPAIAKHVAKPRKNRES
jgi:hypothetical protein